MVVKIDRFKFHFFSINNLGVSDVEPTVYCCVQVVKSLIKKGDSICSGTTRGQVDCSIDF